MLALSHGGPHSRAHHPVALAITANVLVAMGAEPSMSTHPRDITTLMGSADAVLVNLGMLEPDREAAIEVLLADAGLRDRRWCSTP